MLNERATRLFLSALWEPSEALDGPQSPRRPSLVPGENRLEFLLRLKTFEERERETEGRALFEAWRAGFANACAKLLRLGHCGRLAAIAKEAGCVVLRAGMTDEAISATYHVLSFASEQTQHRFLQGGTDFQDAVISAVIADGGLYDERGRWVDLP